MRKSLQELTSSTTPSASTSTMPSIQPLATEQAQQVKGGGIDIRSKQQISYGGLNRLFR